jgi:hypothetical protein
MAAIKNKSQGKAKGLKLLIFLIVLGVFAWLIWKYRLLIMGWFSGGSSTDGPSTTQVTTIIQSGGNGGSSGGGSNTQAGYWPLKRGSKNEHVRWVQIMLNKIPNTGSKLIEDGNWGPKTETKFNAAKNLFGYTVSEISYINYLRMFCYTWPDSDGCKQFKQQYPNL